MRLGRLPEPVLWAAAAAALAAFAVAQTAVFYETSPMIGLVLPVALATAAIVFNRPAVGIYGGIAAVGLEVIPTQITPMEGLLLLAAAGLAARWAFGMDRPRVDPIFVIFGIALLWMITGLSVARDHFIIERTLIMWTGFGVVALAVSNASKRDVRNLMWAIVVGAVFTALIALANGTAQEARAGATAVEGRAQGSFTHPAQLAFFLVMSLPPALVLAVRHRGALRVVATAAALVMFVVLILTLTRGAIIGAAVSLAIMLVWAPFRKIAGIVLVSLLIVGVVQADKISQSQQLQLVGARLATITDSQQANVNNNRLRIWKTVPRMVGDRPVFGIGAGNFKDYSFDYSLRENGRPFAHAHNVALTVLVEQGVPGFLLLVALLVALGRVAVVALGRRRHPDFPYALACMAGLGGLFVNSLTDYPPGSNPNMALMLIEIGLLVAATRALRRPPA